jgi:hypothetical protein
MDCASLLALSNTEAGSVRSTGNPQLIQSADLFWSAEACFSFLLGLFPFLPPQLVIYKGSISLQSQISCRSGWVREPRILPAKLISCITKYRFLNPLTQMFYSILIKES